MKTKLFLLLMLPGCIISCVNSNKPLTDTEKEKVLAEAKAFVSTVNKANVDLNAESLSALYDSASYLTVGSGKIQSYKDVFGNPEELFATAEKLKVDILDSRYSVIDASTVLYGEVSRFEETFKDSSKITGKPWNLSYVLRKVNNKWNIVGDVSYGHTEITRASSQNRELNQLELYKKYYQGTWQVVRNDTITTLTYKPWRENGAEGSTKVVCNGKVLYEAHSVSGYNITHDAMLTETVYPEAGNALVWVRRFMTPTKVEIFPMDNINEPQFSRVRFEADLSSPDIIVQKMFIEDKPVRTSIYKKVN
jgi:hypothetical protein